MSNQQFSLTATEQKWLIHIRRANEAGLPLTRYAKQYGVSASALYQAQATLKKRGYPLHPEDNIESPRSGFLEINLPSDQTTQTATQANTHSGPPVKILLPNGICLETQQALTQDLLHSLASLAL